MNTTREIKFRVWDKNEKKMLTHEEFTENRDLWLTLNGDIYKVNPEGNRYGLAGFQFEILQFTGLKDKNGQDIYEGDIIDEGEETLANLGRVYDVRWADNGWSLCIGPFHQRHFKDAEHMTKIGNIYEHSHLLTKDSKEAQTKGGATSEAVPTSTGGKA